MRNVAAIDVGGTKILGAVVREDGEVLIEKRVPAEFEEGGLHQLDLITDLVNEFKNSFKIDAIGIGIGGRINANEGIINWGVKEVPNYFGLEVKKIMEERFNIPCAVDNDVKVAGMGEAWLGAAKDLKSYVIVTLGTGVGGAIKVNSKLLHGEHWSGGELGHIILYPHGRKCTCGFEGCVEQYLSGTALVKIYNELSDKKINNGYELFERVKNNEEIANKVINNFIDDLYTLLMTLCNGYDPEKIIIGGGLIDTKDIWWARLMEKIDESPINQVFKPIIVPATLGNKAGYYGAAFIAFKELKISSDK